MLCNLWTERDRPKMSTDHLHKNEVAKSNGDIMSGLLRPFMAETTSGLFFELHQII